MPRHFGIIPHPTRIERAARDACACVVNNSADRLPRPVAAMAIVALSLALWAVAIGVPMMLWGS